MENNSLVFNLLVVAILFFILFRARKKNFLIEQKKVQLKTLYKREAVYLCDGIEDLGENLFQFYGEAFGSSIRPGMKISMPSGEKYTIKEVYADDKTPDKPDYEISNGMINTAIVVETDNFNWGNLKQTFKQEGVLALRLLQ